MTIDTKAVRALADKLYQGCDAYCLLTDDDIPATLRQCADEIDTLRELVLEVLDESTLKPDWFERAEKALK